MNRGRASLFLAQIPIVAFLVFFSVGASSEPPLAKRLVSSMLFKEQLESGREECQKKATSLDVEAVQARNPALFLDIGPSSSTWPQAEAAYIQYVKQMCLPVSAESYSERAENTYSDRLSSAELKATIDFLRSPAGKKFTLASVEVTKQVNEAMSIEAEKAQEIAWKAYEEQILKLREK